MESIFTESSEQSIQEEGHLFSYESKSARDPGTVLSSSSKASTPEPEDDFPDIEEEEEHNIQQKGKPTKTHKKPLTGLDLLIRNTTGDSPVLHPSNNQRKLSFVFDKALLSKLKAIARLEKTYFRELVTVILKRFVDGYEKDNGKIDT